MLALLLEGLLGLLLLTLAPSITRRDEASMAVFSLDSPPVPAEIAAPPEPSPPDPVRPKPLPKAEPEPALPQPAEPPLAPPALPVITLSPEQMIAADIGAMRPAPPAPAPRPMVGPPDTGAAGDTPRVAGAGPNGEPLYAASWYREPSEDELRGYLSTAGGPGWGLIACRTVSDYRVEDCVAVAEHPVGSNINRAILAAAWQFRVRPPRVGGRLKIGEWVRIRIDYGLRRP
jgi:protein TonB